AASRPLRLLFVKERMSWPRSSGHDVHCYYSMQALSHLGHWVGLVTLDQPAPAALAGVELSRQVSLRETETAYRNERPLLLSKSQEKFRSYWGIEKNRIRLVGEIADEFQADAVIVVGLNV